MLGIATLGQHGTLNKPRPLLIIREAVLDAAFTEKQIELVSTFADQAAIAIENVRLFESVEARTRELAKSLVICGPRRTA